MKGGDPNPNRRPALSANDSGNDGARDQCHLEIQSQMDMQQVWTEAQQLQRATHAEPHEMAALNDHKAEFQAIDSVEERLQTRLAWDAPTAQWSWFTSTEILLMVGIDQPTRRDASWTGRVMRKLNGGRARRCNGKTLLFCPPKTVESVSERLRAILLWLVRDARPGWQVHGTTACEAAEYIERLETENQRLGTVVEKVVDAIAPQRSTPSSQT